MTKKTPRMPPFLPEGGTLTAEELEGLPLWLRTVREHMARLQVHTTNDDTGPHSRLHAESGILLALLCLGIAELCENGGTLSQDFESSAKTAAEAFAKVSKGKETIQ